MAPAWVALAAVAVLLLPIGCRKPQTPQGESVQSIVERGPLRLTVQAAPKQVWLGDPVTLRLSVHTPAEYVVQFPPAAQTVGDLTVRGVDTRDPRPAADGGLDWQQTLTLDSLASGAHEIPALGVKYARKPPDAQATPAFDQELLSDPLRIEVRSALTSQDSVSRPRDVTGTLTPPWRLSARQWTAIGSVAAAAIGLAYGLYRLVRHLRAKPAPPVLPEVWALRALGELSAGDWMETGRTREFYYRLTEVVRGYIERKFGLAAPEMTTEEFLGVLGRTSPGVPGGAADPAGLRARAESARGAPTQGPHASAAPTSVLLGHSHKLRRFLESCDIVKYAAFQPRREDAEEALGTARAFVDATAAAAVQQGTSQAGPAPAGAGGEAS